VTELGRVHTLSIKRETSVGLYLGSDSVEDILLPRKYCPKNYSIDDELEVFIYLDSEERRIATTIIHEMEEEYWYVVYLDFDEKSGRLFASNRIEKYLDNEHITVSKGEEVELYVFIETELGYTVIINKKHKGLVFHNEIFTEINPGDTVKGYIKEVRNDGKIDVSLQPIGYANSNSKNTDLIYKAIVDNNGSIALTDKSSPDEIYKAFGISKKAFKRALGDLYKQRKISIEESLIKLVN